MRRYSKYWERTRCRRSIRNCRKNCVVPTKKQDMSVKSHNVVHIRRVCRTRRPACVRRTRQPMTHSTTKSGLSIQEDYLECRVRSAKVSHFGSMRASSPRFPLSDTRHPVCSVACDRAQARSSASFFSAARRRFSHSRRCSCRFSSHARCTSGVPTTRGLPIATHIQTLPAFVFAALPQRLVATGHCIGTLTALKRH